MQIRIFAIPLLGGEALTEDMNVFLRSKKVIQVKDQLMMQGEEGAFWCFCVRYVDDVAAAEREKGQKIDYRKVLDPATFERFSAFRAIRKQVAQDDGVMPYVVFYDAELAEMAKMETVTPEGSNPLP